MDKNGKLFGKISILDILVLLLVLGVGAGTVYKYTSSRTVALGGNTKIEYTTVITGVRTFTLENYKVGLKCFDTKTGESIGTITDVRSEPLRETMEMPTGELVLAERSDVIKIYLDIEATGVETDQAYLINGTYEVKAGSELALTTKYVDAASVVESVSTH